MSLNEADIFSLIARQKALAEEIEKHYVNFTKDSPSRKTQSYKDERLTRLESLWLEFDANHKKLVPLVKHDTPYMMRGTRGKVKDIYETYKQKLESLPFPSGTADQPKVTITTGGSKSEDYTNPSDPAQTKEQKCSKAPEEATLNGTAQIKRLRILQLKITSIVDNMDEFEATFKEYSKEIYEYQQKILLDQLKNLSDLHEDYIANATEEDMQVSYITQNEYRGIKQDINRFLHTMASTLTNNSYEKTNKQDSLLPRLKIPTFKGNYLEWQQFYDLFVNIIHAKKSLSTTEKMEYLKTHLEGEPLHLIKHLTFSSNNYDSAWEILKGRYNNERKIVSMHIEKILKFSYNHNSIPSASSIKNTLDAIKEGLAALNNLGYDTSTWDPMVVHITTKSLDSESRNLFEQSLNEPNKMPTLKTLLDFLERRYQAIEVMTTNKKYQRLNTDQPKLSVRNFAINTSSILCPMCNEEHKIYKCQNFLKLSPKEGWQQCKQAKICLNCLSHNKQIPCLSKRNCHHCNKKHHSFLHMQSMEKSDKTNQEKSSKQCNHSEQNQNVFIATALLKVNNENGDNLKIRALIDPGSQASLITEAVAQTLKLNRQNVCVKVSGLGSTKAGIAKNKVDVTIMPHFASNFKLRVEALVLPNLTRQLPSKKANNHLIERFDHQALADPTFNIPGAIDMIIGADAYGDIILSNLRRFDTNTLIAQESKLGCLIYGRISSDTFNMYTVTGLTAFDHLKIETIENKQCNCLFNETHFRKNNGRYVVKILFNGKLMLALKLGEPKNANESQKQ